jgi:hypothetical protein
MIVNLRKRHTIVVDWCCMCKSSGKTVHRLLHHCATAREISTMVWSLCGVQWVMPRGVSELLDCWQSHFGWHQY